MTNSKELTFLELGGGTGTASLDIMKTLDQKYPSLLENTQYYIVNPLHKDFYKERHKEYKDYIKYVREFPDIPKDANLFILGFEYLSSLPNEKIKKISEEEIKQIYITADNKEKEEYISK